MAVFLLANDDGIHSEGLHILCKRISQLGQVYIAAPDREQSACGHAISLHRPLRMVEREIAGATQAWEVDGTPADCVKLAIEGALLPEQPDLVISGINRGSNLGTDVLYSGTVSAAIEATLIGFPAMAVSLCDPSKDGFELAAEVAVEIASVLLKNTLPKSTLLNINVPGVRREELAGITVARLGRRQYSKVIERRVDPRGKVYYWIAGEPVLNNEKDKDTDIDAIIQNKVSVTPLQFDLTRSDIMPAVSKIIDEAGFFQFPFVPQSGQSGSDGKNGLNTHALPVNLDNFPGGTP